MTKMKQSSEKITCPVCGKSDHVRKLSAAYKHERAKHPDSPHANAMQPPENIREAAQIMAEQEILDELKSDSERYHRYKDFLESLKPMYETHHRARVDTWETLYYCMRDDVVLHVKSKKYAPLGGLDTLIEETLPKRQQPAAMLTDYQIRWFFKRRGMHPRTIPIVSATLVVLLIVLAILSPAKFLTPALIGIPLVALLTFIVFIMVARSRI